MKTQPFGQHGRQHLTVAAAALAVLALALPASASAWSRAFKVSPLGAAIGAELDNDGVLRIWWEGSYQFRPRRGVDLATPAGKMTAVKRSDLDHYTEKNFGGNPAYEEPAALDDGRWLRCAVTINRSRTQAHIFMLVYSHSGGLVKRLLIASQSEDTSALGPVAPTCQVASAGSQAIVEFTQQTPTTNPHQGNRQIYVVRVLPGLKVTTPPLLPSGEVQQTFFSGTTEQASLSSSGWVAVAWTQGDVTRQTSSRVEQCWQFEMRWISPTGNLSPVIALGRFRGGRLCKVSSLQYGGLVPTPAVEAVGAERALVVFGAPRLESEEVRGVRVTATKVISQEEAFLSPEPGHPQVALDGHTVVVTWGGGTNKRGHCMPIRATQWRQGRWSQSDIVGRPALNKCLFNPLAYANSRGQASVTWFHEISRPLQTGYMQGVFAAGAPSAHASERANIGARETQPMVSRNTTAPLTISRLSNHYDAAVLGDDGLLRVAWGPNRHKRLSLVNRRHKTMTVRLPKPPGAGKGGVERLASLADGQTLALWGDVTSAQSIPTSAATYSKNGAMRHWQLFPSSSTDSVQAADVTSLGNGGAVLCWVREARDADSTRAVFVELVSSTGRFAKPMLAAESNRDQGSELSSCWVASSGSHTVIAWAVSRMDPSVPAIAVGRYQRSRQVYVSRLLSDQHLSRPMAILPEGDDQLETLDGGEQSINVTPAGWVAVSWPYAKITREALAEDRVAQVTQWRTRWITPGDELTSVIPLEAPRGGQLCKQDSPVCGLAPTPPTITAIGSGRLLATFITPQVVRSEEIDTTGHVSAQTIVSRVHNLNVGGTFGGGGVVVATWSEDVANRAAVYEDVWRAGRWSSTRLLATRHGELYPTDPQPLANSLGEAWATWDVRPDSPPMTRGRIVASCVVSRTVLSG